MIVGKVKVLSFIRFALVGVATNSLGYSAYLLLTFLRVPPLVCISFLYPLAIVTSYLGHQKYTFEHRSSGRQAFLRYMLIQITAYLVNITLLAILPSMLGIPHQIVQLFLIFLIAAILFLLYRLMVFPETK